MNINYYQPPECLKKYVRYFWSCDVLGSKIDTKIYFENYADKHPRLVFQVENLSQLKLNDDKFVPQTYLCGIETLPSKMSVEASFSHFGVSFNSFAIIDIFKIESEFLVNQMVDLNYLGYNNLILKLTDAHSHLSRIEIMCKFILDQISTKNYVHQNIVQIVLENELVDEISLNVLQKKYKISERTMERMFKSAIGISPKKFKDLLRFEKSIDLLKKPDYANSSELIYLLNYTDQSHFIKEFKKFTDITPSQFQKNHYLLSESSAYITVI